MRRDDISYGGEVCCESDRLFVLKIGDMSYAQAIQRSYPSLSQRINLLSTEDKHWISGG